MSKLTKLQGSQLVDGTITNTDIADATITGAKLVNSTITNTQVGLASSITGTPADPAGTTSTTAVMAGLGISFTPSKTGIIRVSITGLLNNNTAGDGGTVQLAYGTGTAPANGDAATGTTVGSLVSVLSSAASQNQAFALTSIISGSSGTAYWIDLQFAAVTGGTASLTNLSYVVEELLA